MLWELKEILIFPFESYNSVFAWENSDVQLFSFHVFVKVSVFHCCTGSITVRALFSKPLLLHLQCARLFLRSIFAVTMVISFLSRFASLQILLLMSGQEWYMLVMLHGNVRQNVRNCASVVSTYVTIWWRLVPHSGTVPVSLFSHARSCIRCISGLYINIISTCIEKAN